MEKWKAKPTKVVVFFIVIIYACSASASIELALDGINEFDLMTSGSTLSIRIVSINETQDFSMHLDVFKLNTGYVGELTDLRTGQVVSDFSVFSTGPIDPPDFILNNPTLGPAAGDLGSYFGSYPILDGYRIDFSREQSVGLAPNGVIGGVDLTVVPEPATMLLLGLGGILIRRINTK